MTLATGAKARSVVPVSPPKVRHRTLGQRSVVQGVGSHLQINVSELEHQ